MVEGEMRIEMRWNPIGQMGRISQVVASVETGGFREGVLLRRPSDREVECRLRHRLFVDRQ